MDRRSMLVAYRSALVPNPHSDVGYVFDADNALKRNGDDVFTYKHVGDETISFYNYDSDIDERPQILQDELSSDPFSTSEDIEHSDDEVISVPKANKTIVDIISEGDSRRRDESIVSMLREEPKKNTTILDIINDGDITIKDTVKVKMQASPNNIIDLIMYDEDRDGDDESEDDGRPGPELVKGDCASCARRATERYELKTPHIGNV